MANHNFPGVYPTIKDLSQIVSANAITSCAYVGEADFGPINTPILVSNLKAYTDKFGSLNPKYGYMGYSLAVASDTINSHYVVRVVDEDTALYGATFVALNGKTAKSYNSGYSVEEVEAAKKDSSAFFYDETTQQVSDNDAFVVVANNPNNKEIQISVADSTINTNKNIQATKITSDKTIITLPQEGLFEENDKITISRPDVITSDGSIAKYPAKVVSIVDTYNFDVSVASDDASTNYSVGDTFTVNGITLADSNTLTGKVIAVKSGKVTAVALDTYNDEGTQTPGSASYSTTNGVTADENANGLKVQITISKFKNKITVLYDPVLSGDILAEEWKDIRVLKMPADNETTFSLAVYEVNGKVTTRVEFYQYLTLYANKDINGNSTFVEDVVNTQSQYVQVFANAIDDTRHLHFPEYPVPETFSLRELKGGTSGTSIAKAANGTKFLTNGWDNFKDRTATTVTLLMNSGYAYESNLAYQSKMIEVAEKRRDCFALLDVPQTLSSNSEKVLDWRKNVLGFNTYRASLTTPWVRTYDSVQGKSNFLMAPSAYVAKIMGTSRPWIAPAGPNRGIISSATVSPIGLTEAYDDTTGGTLYDAQLNCIVRNPGAGWAVWGQKTLQQKPSALDRINVARTIIYIETTLRDAARYHLFENNTAFERMQVTLQFNQFLDTILADSGIQKYQVVCDDSNNTPYIIANNTMVIDIYIWPTYTTEFIELNTIVMGPDANITVTANQ